MVNLIGLFKLRKAHDYLNISEDIINPVFINIHVLHVFQNISIKHK